MCAVLFRSFVMATLDGRQDVHDAGLLQGALGKEDALNSKESVDPLVYKLVRVEGDGTLVPATEDEVEHLLEDDRDQKYRKHSHSENMMNNLDKYSPNSDSDVENEEITGLWLSKVLLEDLSLARMVLLHC